MFSSKYQNTPYHRISVLIWTIEDDSHLFLDILKHIVLFSRTSHDIFVFSFNSLHNASQMFTPC